MPSPGGPHRQDQENREERVRSSAQVVLLVEDNATDAFVIQRVVDHCDLNVELHVARDGQDALLYLKHVAEEQAPCPVLVLLDLNLPKVRGIEVLRQLRGGVRCRKVPVIVITSSNEEADRAEAERLGADDYFQKPADLATYMELAHVIQRIVRHLENSSDPPAAQ